MFVTTQLLNKKKKKTYNELVNCVRGVQTVARGLNMALCSAFIAVCTFTLAFECTFFECEINKVQFFLGVFAPRQDPQLNQNPFCYNFKTSLF